MRLNRVWISLTSLVFCGFILMPTADATERRAFRILDELKTNGACEGVATIEPEYLPLLRSALGIDVVDSYLKTLLTRAFDSLSEQGEAGVAMRARLVTLDLELRALQDHASQDANHAEKKASVIAGVKDFREMVMPLVQADAVFAIPFADGQSKPVAITVLKNGNGEFSGRVIAEYSFDISELNYRENPWKEAKEIKIRVERTIYSVAFAKSIPQLDLSERARINDGAGKFFGRDYVPYAVAEQAVNKGLPFFMGFCEQAE